MLQLISLVMLIYSYFLIQTSLPKLPHHIPTHYNAAGVANGWGSPDMLWILLGAQALTCAVFLLVPYLGQRFPGSVHFGSRRLSDFSPAQQERLLPILNEMGGCLSVVMNLFFVFMLRQVIQQATESIPHLYMLWPLTVLVAGTLGVTLFYFRKFNQAAKDEGNESTPRRR
jgi:uncharacterized membrane protein